MKVLYHHRTTARDGSSVHIDGLIDALRGLGAEVLLIAPGIASTGPSSPARWSWLASLRRRMPRFLHELLEIAYNVPEGLRLLKAVREFDPDFIYQRSNLFLVSGLLVARVTRRPLIVEVNSPLALERSLHGGLALRRLGQWLEAAVWRGASRVVAVTAVLRDIIVAENVPTERVEVMPNGIEALHVGEGLDRREAKRRLGLSGKTVLGFTGFVRDWNGLDRVLDLLALPGGEQLHLLVVGDGPARPALEEKARSAGVSEGMSFTGVVPRQRVPEFVAAFDIALLPAANPYASPLKALEYMALGCAIVAPDQRNIHELLEPERTAILFDPNCSSALCEAVNRLAENPALRARLGEAARESLLMRDLSWRRNASRVLDVARELVLEHGQVMRAPNGK